MIMSRTGRSVRNVPLKSLFGTVCEEKCGPIEAVFGVKIFDLFLGRGLAQYHRRRIAGDKLYQQRDEGHDGPDHEQHKSELASNVQKAIFHSIRNAGGQRDFIT
jgi:hypothetical protein